MTNLIITGGSIVLPDGGPARGTLTASLDYVQIPMVPVFKRRPLGKAWGICVHPTFSKDNNVYDNVDAWFEQVVLASGTKTIRGMYGPNNPGSKRTLELCKQHGIGWIATIIPEDGYNWTDKQVRDRCAAIRRDDPNGTVFIAVELMNEPNHSRTAQPVPQDWAARVAHQAVIIRAELPDIFILSSALHQAVKTSEQDHYTLAKALKAAAGTVGAAVDGVSVHDYDGGQRPCNRTDERLDLTEDAFGRLDGYVISEYGRHNAVNVGMRVHQPNSEWAADQYAVRDVIERVLDDRVLYVMQYEGMDDPKPLTEHEAHFGIVRAPKLDPSTWTPKPSLGSLRDMVVLASEASDVDEVPLLIEELDGIPVRSLVTDEQIVWLWQDVVVYDTDARKDIVPTPAKVRLTTPTGSREIEVDGQAAPFALP